jgi:hypothetical protein
MSLPKFPIIVGYIHSLPKNRFEGKLCQTFVSLYGKLVPKSKPHSKEEAEVEFNEQFQLPNGPS